MSSLLNARTILAGAAAALFAGLALSAQAQASVTSKLMRCDSSSRDGAIACCQDVVGTYGVPAWLGSRDNCNRSVSCGSTGKGHKCRIKMTYILKPMEKSPGEGGGGGGGKQSGNNKP